MIAGICGVGGMINLQKNEPHIYKRKYWIDIGKSGLNIENIEFAI